MPELVSLCRLSLCEQPMWAQPMWRQPMSDFISLCCCSLCRITCVSLCQNWSAYVDAAYVESRVSAYVGIGHPMCM